MNELRSRLPSCLLGSRLDCCHLGVKSPKTYFLGVNRRFQYVVKYSNLHIIEIILYRFQSDFAR